MIAKVGRTLPSLLGLLGLLSVTSTALAQGNTFNPYGNSGYADYREFGNAMLSNNPALPGQALLNSEPLITRPRANSYQQFTLELDGSDSDSSTSRRSGATRLPYYQAYQRLNPQYNRVYRPNDTAQNDEFFKRQKQRDAAYAKVLQDRARAFEERDPVKRAQLLRKIDQEYLNSTTPSSRSRAGTASPRPNSGTVAPIPSTRAPAPPGPGSATERADRRTPAPSPFPSTNARRPNSTRSPAPGIPGVTDPSTSRATPPSRPAPDPSTIPVPPPR